MKTHKDRAVIMTLAAVALGLVGLLAVEGWNRIQAGRPAPATSATPAATPGKTPSTQPPAQQPQAPATDHTGDSERFAG